MLGFHFRIWYYVIIKGEADTDDDDDNDEVTCEEVERHQGDLGHMLIACRVYKKYFCKINQEEKSRIRRWEKQKRGTSSGGYFGGWFIFESKRKLIAETIEDRHARDHHQLVLHRWHLWRNLSYFTLFSKLFETRWLVFQEDMLPYTLETFSSFRPGFRRTSWWSRRAGGGKYSWMSIDITSQWYHNWSHQGYKSSRNSQHGHIQNQHYHHLHDHDHHDNHHLDNHQ